MSDSLEGSIVVLATNKYKENKQENESNIQNLRLYFWSDLYVNRLIFS